MRIIHLLAGAAALAIASPAFAQSTPVSFSPAFQTALEEDYGAREGEYLRTAVVEAINNELARRGVAPGAINVDITIVDAEPNRPTTRQLIHRPSLDASSISIGGAELRAELRATDGRMLEEVTHRRYSHTLGDVGPAATTWTEARRAIRQFAIKVADAYVAHAR
jgi:hypothetical protein